MKTFQTKRYFTDDDLVVVYRNDKLYAKGFFDQVFDGSILEKDFFDEQFYWDPRAHVWQATTMREDWTMYVLDI